MSDSLFEEDDEPDVLVRSTSHENIDDGKAFQTQRSRLANTAERASKELSFGEFLEVITHLRPGTNASVLDIADVRKSLRFISRRLEYKLDAPSHDCPANISTKSASFSVPCRLRKQFVYPPVEL